jgi:hypothetical protein
MSRVDQLRAELELAELEAALVAAKESGDNLTAIKHKVRAARQAYRETREV